MDFVNNVTLVKNPQNNCIRAVYGAIRQKWLALGQRSMSTDGAILLTGWPLNDESFYWGATGTAAVGINPDYVTGLKWWEHKQFTKGAVLQAAELVAVDALDLAGS